MNVIKKIAINKVAAMLLSVAAIYSFSACSKDENEEKNDEEEHSRTVIFYIAADNSLSNNAKYDLKEIYQGMQNLVIGEDDKVVVYVDDTYSTSLLYLDKKLAADGTGDFELIHEYSEEINSCDSEMLKEVLSLVKSKYKSDSYGLVLWSHGTGWMPSLCEKDGPLPAKRRTFGLDNSEVRPGRQMRVSSLAKAVEDTGGVDFIFFDACFMQCIEVAYQLRNATRYVIGSPCELPGEGANYTTMVEAMFSKDNYAEKMVEAYYKEYSDYGDTYGINVSAIKTAELESYSDYMKGLVGKYSEELRNADYDYMLNYFQYEMWQYQVAQPNFFDMQAVMLEVLDDNDYKEWRKRTNAVIIKNMETQFWYSSYNNRKNYFDVTECCGVSMFIPMEVYDNYNNNNFNKSILNTEWGEKVWSQYNYK